MSRRFHTKLTDFAQMKETLRNLIAVKDNHGLSKAEKADQQARVLEYYVRELLSKFFLLSGPLDYSKKDR